MRKPLLAAPAVAMLILTATTSTLIQIVARTSPRLSRYSHPALKMEGIGRGGRLGLCKLVSSHVASERGERDDEGERHQLVTA